MQSDDTEQITRGEHWLPRATHLERFAKNKKLQVYRFEANDKRTFVKTANHFETGTAVVGKKTDLYEAPSKPTNAVEKTLTQVENLFLPILENKIIKSLPIDEADHLKISYFISALHSRTPAYEKHLHKFMDQIEKMGKQVALAHNAPEAAEKFSKEVAEAREEIFTDSIGISLDVNNIEPLDFCFLVIDDIFKDMEFITGDHPVCTVDFSKANSPYGIHPLSKTAETTVPLTSRIALFANNAGITGYHKIDANYVREVNHRTLGSSNDMVIAASPISESENAAIVKRFPQSLLLKLVDMPDGRMDKMLEEIEKKK